jgi:hypothetical protein
MRKIVADEVDRLLEHSPGDLQLSVVRAKIAEALPEGFEAVRDGAEIRILDLRDAPVVATVTGAEGELFLSGKERFAPEVFTDLGELTDALLKELESR